MLPTLTNRSLLAIGFFVLLLGSISAIFPQTKTPYPSRVDQRIANLELDSDKAGEQLTLATNRIIRLETKIESLEKSLDSIWNMQLGIVGALSMMIIQGFFTKNGKD